MTTATILSCYIAKFEAFVATKNKKAVKLGCPEIKFEISAPFVKETPDGVFEFVKVEVDESIISLNGWNVKGRIDDEEGVNIVAGYGDMSAYRNVSMTRCDHCNTARTRKHLVVVSNGSEEKVVGAQCLTDFVGHPSALAYLSAMSWVLNLGETLEEEGFSSGRSEACFDIAEIIALSAAATRQWGYTSRAVAEEKMCLATVDQIRCHLSAVNDNARITVSEEDREQAAKALAWIESVEDNSDFFYNLKTLTAKAYTKNRFLGYIAAIIPCYLKSLVKETQAPSEFIGEVGQKKVRMEVQCTNIVTLDGNYGTSWMFIFKAGSNVIKYVSSAFDCSVGDNMVIEATIKDHAVYNSKKQTVITRAKKIA